ARIGMGVAAAATLRHDVYYHPARTNEKWPGRTTPTKDQVDDSTWVWCEVDPRAKEPFDAERERIASLPWPDGVPPAAFTICSGGGRLFLWSLRRAVAQEECEAILRWLSSKFPGADPARSNINSLLRVPRTINWSGAGK